MKDLINAKYVRGTLESLGENITADLVVCLSVVRAHLTKIMLQVTKTSESEYAINVKLLKLEDNKKLGRQNPLYPLNQPKIDSLR